MLAPCQPFAFPRELPAPPPEPGRLSLAAPRANLSITARGKASIAVSVNTDVNLARADGGKPAHVKADMLLPDAGPITGSATISRLDLAALGANAPLFQPLRNVPLSTNLSVTFNIAQGGHVSQTDFDLSADGDLPWRHLKNKRPLQINSTNLLIIYWAKCIG